ncbi:PREDICTED: glutathione S-transferase T3-like [Camelina sativa]|uniref:Glutathione S-transferase T3-like n=1 Tax=Camelina sativa TaxID=90675 RepID=A0ABM1QTL7_CAMSA|nr:PREDICTED: glutathione S-transferase T3-like [Camelina sativa]
MDLDDGMNQYRPSCFFNLLQSQLETQNLEYTPYESPCSNAPSEPASPQENCKSRHAWLPIDDVMLVSAWLNTSKDPIISNEQRRGAFWFIGCYEAAAREKSSGHSEDDVMKLAHRIYFNDHKQRFTLEHGWRELGYDQKWCASTSIKGNGVKRGRVGEDRSAQDAQPVIDVEYEPKPRPIGVKAAWGKAKKSSNTKPDVEGDGKAFLEFQMERVVRMYEMKQKDFALKEKEFALKKEHIKHVMVENLVAKKDSLTETEKAIKDKLINDVMSLG